MKFSKHWLQEFIVTELSTEALVERLNLLGLEVEAIEPVAPQFSGVVVGKVEHLQAHPNAERLRLCTVDDGSGDLLQIVCGALNVAAGAYYPLARIGAELPGGLKIKKTRLRNIDSMGMLCSAAELGLSEDTEGLLALPSATPGTDLHEVLDLHDTSIVLDLTPNRGDCLSVLGVARELAAATHSKLNYTIPHPVPAANDARISIEISTKQACPSYVGRVFKNIMPDAQTPLWMVERLRRSGLRAIHPVVDVTNYVMLELGQPMHAFDLQRLQGGIKVRMAAAGERILLLNGDSCELQANTLVIADHNQPCAIAGVMGGELSAVRGDTRDIVLESAFFAPAALAGKARQYALHTDSSHRFERGVDPHLQVYAIERATALLMQIVGGQPGPVLAHIDNAQLPQREAITLRRPRISRLLGQALSDEEVRSILQGLGMQCVQATDGWRITPPSHRFDIHQEADLIEEIARFHGYTNFSKRLPVLKPAIHNMHSERRISAARIEQCLIERGYQEVISYSFVDPQLQNLVEPEAPVLSLSNPISSEMSVMRRSLMTGLLSALKINLNRQQKHISLYETGLSFTLQENDLKQENMICGLRYGDRYGEHWDQASAPLDFYDIKGDVEALLALAGMRDHGFRISRHPALHPGQAAEVYRGNQSLGILGALHPRICQALSLDKPAYVFELSSIALMARQPPRFTPISKYPRNRRDLAIVVDQAITWAEVEQIVRVAADQSLQDVILFDVYSGKSITSGRKSFAIGLILQEISRTLTDNEIELTVHQVLTALQQNLGATLRE